MADGAGPTGAGKYYIHFDLFGLCWNWHVFPKREYRLWGYTQEWYDGPIHSFGVGPIFYVCTHDELYIHPERRRQKNI